MYASRPTPSASHEGRDWFSSAFSADPFRSNWGAIASQAGAAAFALAFLVYVSLTPWVVAHWPVTGDEPHYLLISHSLLADADIKMANNYQARDYARFFDGPWLDPHVMTRSDGEWYPVHEIALSLIIAPAFRLAGRTGVIYLLNLVAALVAANVWLLAHELTGDHRASWFAWLATTFTIPLLPYAFSIYTEMIAALLVIWTTRNILRRESLSPWRWASIGLCLVALPWLVIRFLPLALVLLVGLVLRVVSRRERALGSWLACGSVIGLALLVISILNRNLYGDAAAIGASSVGRGEASIAQLLNPINHLDSLMGWLVDQRMGLFVLAPAYALAIVGLLVLWRRQRWAALILGGLVLVQHASLGFTRFQVRWGIPPRYLVVVLPLAGGLMAVAWEAVRGPLFRLGALLLLAISLLSSGLVLTDPWLAFHNDFDDGKLLGLYGERLGVDVGRVVPRFMPPVRYKDKGWDDRESDDAEPSPYLLAQFRTLTSPAGELVSDPDAAGGIATRPRLGLSGALLDGPSVSLPAGRYQLVYRLKATGLPDVERTLATILVDLGGGALASRDLANSDLSPAGIYADVSLEFELKERAEIACSLTTTGAATVLVDHATLLPGDAWRARWKALLWCLGILFASVLTFRFWPTTRVESQVALVIDRLRVAREEDTYRRLSVIAILASIVVLARGIYALAAPPEYEAEALFSQTGEIVEDLDASRRQAVKGTVSEDEAGWLTYGPYEPFEPGDYEIRFTVKRGAGAAAPRVAWADVTDVPADHIYVQRDVLLEDLEPGQYHVLSMAFSNPKWQKLVFRVYFADVADFWVDKVELRPAHGFWSFLD